MKRMGDQTAALPLYKNERGVALLIVLLVTALLIALVFEFSYATRISLNSAVNYRDSQRAYFLSRAGITAFLKAGSQIRDAIPEGKSYPLGSALGLEGADIMIKWEDQRGRININTVSSLNWVENLFSLKGISIEVVDRIKEQAAELRKTGKQFGLLSELHAFMSDEDYGKVADFLTVDSDSMININTASEDVLSSVLVDKPWFVSRILTERKNKQISAGDVGLDTSNMGVHLGKLQKDSTYFRVYSYSTVGGYTKQVEAVIHGSTISYWRAL